MAILQNCHFLKRILIKIQHTIGILTGKIFSFYFLSYQLIFYANLIAVIMDHIPNNQNDSIFLKLKKKKIITKIYENKRFSTVIGLQWLKTKTVCVHLNLAKLHFAVMHFFPNF